MHPRETLEDGRAPGDHRAKSLQAGSPHDLWMLVRKECRVVRAIPEGTEERQEARGKEMSLEAQDGVPAAVGCLCRACSQT